MKKNYIATYASNPVTKHQEGGPVQGGAPAPEGGGGGGVQEMLMQVVQSQDPNMALQFCNMLAEQMGMGGQGGAPAPGGAPEGAPMGRYGMEIKAPMFKKGGKL
jgi:hypothetical protein